MASLQESYRTPIHSCQSSRGSEFAAVLPGLTSCASTQLAAALTLISDPSLVVRCAAAEFIGLEAAALERVPAEIFQRIFREPNGEVLSHLITALVSTRELHPVAVPILIRLLRDTRTGIAVDAARALGDQGDYADGALVPLHIIGHSSSNWRDARIDAFFDGDGVVNPEVRDSRYKAVDIYLQLAESDHLQLLKQILRERPKNLTEDQFYAALVGIYLPVESTREHSIRVLNKYRSVMGEPQCNLVRCALAFTQPDFEQSEASVKLQFFEALREFKISPELLQMIECVDGDEEIEISMARDFTMICLDPSGNVSAAIERLAGALWEPSARIMGSAASNLTVLLHDINSQVGVQIVDHLMEALVGRAVDGDKFTHQIIFAFAKLENFHAEVLTRCSDLLRLQQNPQVMLALARLMGALPLKDEGLLQKARNMLRYLTGVPYPRVAQMACDILNYSPE